MHEQKLLINRRIYPHMMLPIDDVLVVMALVEGHETTHLKRQGTFASLC